jgi:hypothetical protein
MRALTYRRSDAASLLAVLNLRGGERQVLGAESRVLIEWDIFSTCRLKFFFGSGKGGRS